MAYNKNYKSKKSSYRPKTPIVHYKEDENPWVSYMKRRVLRENNCINGIITGDPGSSKSWCMLSLAEKIEPGFKLEGNLYFKAGKMMRDINRYYNGSDAKPKKAKLWLLDEAGIDANNLKFFDAINKGLNAFFQTARHRNYIFMMTVPHFGFISKGVRTLMNVHGMAKGWDKNTGLSKITIRNKEYNGNIDKYYTKRLYVYKKGFGMIPCNESRLEAPSKKIIKQYENMKKEFTGNLFGSIADEIEAYEEKKEEKMFGKQPTPKQQEVVNLLKRGRRADEIAVLKKVNTSSIRVQMQLLRKKGYKFDPIRDKVTNRIIRYDVYDPNYE